MYRQIVVFDFGRGGAVFPGFRVRLRSFFAKAFRQSLKRLARSFDDAFNSGSPVLIP
jgi:hypothetical protein